MVLIFVILFNGYFTSLPEITYAALFFYQHSLHLVPAPYTYVGTVKAIVPTMLLCQ